MAKFAAGKLHATIDLFPAAARPLAVRDVALADSSTEGGFLPSGMTVDQVVQKLAGKTQAVTAEVAKSGAAERGRPDIFSLLERLPPEDQVAFLKRELNRIDDFQSHSLQFNKSLDNMFVRVFEHQETYNIALFFVVLIIVMTGVGLSIAQFILAYRIDTKQHAQATEVELFNMKLKTSAIGLAVLFISLAFFHIYLIEVYTVKPMKGN